MPASSRKRNKGKDRKAKKEESKRIEMYNDWQVWATCMTLLISGTRQVVELCNHGLVPVLPEESHPVSRFITDFFTVNEDLNIILQRHPEVRINDNYRKMTTDILTRIDTNCLIEGGEQPFGANVAKAIIIIENYGKTGDYLSTVTSRSVATKCRELSCHNGSIKRDFLKFYRKRMKCKCLKELHLEARKTLPKLGRCHNCGVIKERRLLMVCSRCMVAPYCSRDCQVAASSGHREDCDMHVWAHQRTIDST